MSNASTMTNERSTIAPPVRLIACPRPFSIDRIEQQLPEGLPVADLFRQIGLNPDPIFARVFIDDQLVPKAEWEWAVPRAGQCVTIRVIPTDGGGQGKDALRIVAMIGVIAASLFAPYLAPVGWGLVGSWTGAALTATLSIAGSLAVNALIPPPKPKLEALSSPGNTSPTLSLTGTSNQLAPYAPIPRVYGRHRIFPPLAARPYTEVVGSDQYLRLLFCCGYGPLALSELKIGQTPIEQFSDIETEIRYGFSNDAALTIFPDDVFEDALSIKLTFAAGFQQRTSQATAQQLSVDVTFPTGLNTYVQVGETFQYVQWAVQVQIDYRKVGDVSWTTVTSVPESHGAVTTAWAGANNDLTFTAVAGGTPGNGILIAFIESTGLSVQLNGTSVVLIGYVPGVTTASAIKTALQADAAITAVVTVANAPANNGTGTVPATGADDGWLSFQTTGGYYAPGDGFVIDNRATLVRANWTWTPPDPTAQYEVRVKRVTADSDPLTTRDEVYWTMLRTIQKGQPVQKTGLCLVAMRIRATDQLNGTVDQFNCIAQSLLPDWNGSAWVLGPTSNPASIYRDILQGSANARPLADSRLDLTTIQAFHVRCASKGFQFNGVIDFKTTVFELCRDVLAAGRGSFGLRDGKYSVVEEIAQTTPVQHFTPRNSWGFRGTKVFVDLPHALKTRFVNPDRDWQQDERFVYADGYSSANATKFETLDLMGVTSGDQAWKLGRYHLAVATLRPETYEINTDIENLVCTRGDLVRVVHDVPLFGAGYGRIKSLTTDGGGNATAFTMDDVITMDGTKSYAVRFRKADGTSLVQQIVTVAGEQSSFTFTAAISSATKPAVGDLALLGVLGSESVEMMVKSIEPGPDLTAKLTLVDYASAVQTADSGSIPAFDSQITLPVVVQPTQPVITQVQSDESVLLRDVDGSYQSRILVTLHFTSGFRLPVSKVEAQYRPSDSESAWVQLFAPVSGTSIDVTIAPVQDGNSYDIRLRTVDDETGQTSAWAVIEGHTVIGKTMPPPDVATLVYEGGRLQWLYPDAPLDFAGFQVRAHAGNHSAWESAIPLHDGLVTPTTFVCSTDSGVRTYLVKAFDVAGNESALPAFTVVNLGDPETTNVVETIDLKATSFPGTITNGSIVGGNLVADSQVLFWGPDDATFWRHDSETFWPTDTYKELTYQFAYTPPVAWLDGTLQLNLTVAASSWRVEYRRGNQAVFWGNDADVFWGASADLFWPAAGDWLPWPGELSALVHEQYEFRIVCAAGVVRGEISVCQIVMDLPDLEETLQNVAIGAGGTRLPITKSYRAIKVVNPSILGSGSVATIEIMDHDTELGPLVQARDFADGLTTATINARIQGY